MRSIVYLPLLILATTSLVHGQNTGAEDYYYYWEEKIELTRDRRHIGICVEGEQHLAALKRSIEESSSMKVTAVEEDPTRTDYVPIDSVDVTFFYVELESESPLEQEAYAAELERLNKLSSVRIASPTHRAEDGSHTGLSSALYVKLRSEDDLALLYQEAESANLEVLGYDQFMPLWFTLAVTRQTGRNALESANALHETGLFAAAAPAFIVEITLHSNDPYFGDQWMLNNTGQSGGTADVDMDVQAAWPISTGRNVKVAVVDDGIELNHPDLQTNIFGTGFDASSRSTPSVVRGNHGTPCAGIIAAVKDNNEGIAGVAPNAQLMSVSVQFRSFNTIPALARGINWAWQNGADVISNSWGGGRRHPVMDNAIDNALNGGRGGLGTVVVFASGNDNVNGATYPGNSNRRILCVGAVDRCGIRSGRADIISGSCDPWGSRSYPGSSYGAPLDIVAGGTSTLSTDRQGSAGDNGYADNNYTWFGGTSAACPYVAGVAALVLEANPNLTADEVGAIIEKTAKKIRTDRYSYTSTSGRPNGTWNNELGYGMVNARGAVLMAQSTACPQGLVITVNVPSGSVDHRQAANTIRASNAVASGAEAVYHAGEEVLLSDGFDALRGAVFRAYIEGCTGNFQKSASPYVPAHSPLFDYTTPIAAQKTGQSFVPFDRADTSARNLTIYPNPTPGVFHVDLGGQQLDNFNVEIRNVSGALVYDNAFQRENTTDFRVDISSLSAGTYYVRITAPEAGQLFTGKIVKSR